MTQCYPYNFHIVLVFILPILSGRSKYMTSGMTLKRIWILLCSVWNVEPFDCKNFSSFSEILLLLALYLVTLKMSYLLLNARFGINVAFADFTIQLLTNPIFLNVNGVNGLRDTFAPQELKWLCWLWLDWNCRSVAMKEQRQSVSISLIFTNLHLWKINHKCQNFYKGLKVAKKCVVLLAPTGALIVI